MDEREFETLAEQTLRAFMARIEDSLDVDVDLRGGILTIELDDGRQYVLNKHAPNRQLWLSSPLSGASHYGHDPATGGWRSTRGGPPLAELLAAELAQLTGADIAFD
jgi:frataxin